MLYIKIAQH